VIVIRHLLFLLVQLSKTALVNAKGVPEIVNLPDWQKPGKLGKELLPAWQARQM